MELKVSGILIAVIFVAFVEADPCGQRKSQECLDTYMSSSLEERSDSEKCTDKREVAQCLTEVAEECQGDDRNEDIDKAVEEMNQKLAEECGAVDDVDKCVESSGVTVISGCLVKSFLEANDVMGSPDEFDVNEMMCIVNDVLTKCIKEQMTEKCGEGGGQLALVKLTSIIPEDIREQLQECVGHQDSQEDTVQELFSVGLLDQREERELDYKKKREVPSPPSYKKKRAILDPPAYPTAYRKKREVPSPQAYRKKRELQSSPEYRKKRELQSPPEYRKKRELQSPPEYRKKREINSPPAYRKKRQVQSYLPYSSQTFSDISFP